MICHGHAPYLECSSAGDRRFSAFYARPDSLRGLSIEQAYQAAKRFPCPCIRPARCPDCLGTGIITGLGWREAKGRRPVNQAVCRMLYTAWWTEWVGQQGLLPVLRAASGLSDLYGQPGSVCQATVLWRIRRMGLPPVL